MEIAGEFNFAWLSPSPSLMTCQCCTCIAFQHGLMAGGHFNKAVRYRFQQPLVYLISRCSRACPPSVFRCVLAMWLGTAGAGVAEDGRQLFTYAYSSGYSAAQAVFEDAQVRVLCFDMHISKATQGLSACATRCCQAPTGLPEVFIAGKDSANMKQGCVHCCYLGSC